jgi:hypothetical protein
MFISDLNIDQVMNGNIAVTIAKPLLMSFLQTHLMCQLGTILIQVLYESLPFLATLKYEWNFL